MASAFNTKYTYYGIYGDNVDGYVETKLFPKTSRDLEQAYYSGDYDIIHVKARGRYIGYLFEVEDTGHITIWRPTKYDRKKANLIRRGLIEDPCKDLPF